MRPFPRALLPPLVALLFVAGGCSSGGGVPDSRIIGALHLKRAGRLYEMGGDPFCAVQQLLNSSAEVSNASDHPGAAGFVIAGPAGRVGILAQRPFAPDCTQKAEKALKRLERRSG